MSEKLRILLLEDVLSDAELIEHELGKAGFVFTSERVETKKSFLEALELFKPDLILADYTLPKFDALTALKLTQKTAPLTPFIVITGSISEEVAVTCMRQGADDYLLKDRLARLGEAVRQSLDNRRLQAEKSTADRALLAAATQWRATFDAMNDAVCLLDGQGAVQKCNRAMNLLLGLPFEKIIGRDCLDLVCGKDKRKSCAFTQMMKTRQRTEEETFWRGHWYQVRVDPVIDSNGKLVGAVHIMTDFTQSKRAGESLRASTMKLAQAQRIGKLGSWEWNLEGNSLEWSDELYRIWGVDKDLSLTVENITAMIHPDDLASNQAMIQKLLSEQNEGGFEFRIICPDGTVKDLHQHIEVTRSPSGQAVKMFGIMQDNSERKQAEELIRASLREKEVLLQEIHHRVKNNLQIISGLLTLQAAQIGDERLLRVLKESQSRIWTMALIHQTLYQSGNLAAIEMADYIRNLCGNLLSSHTQQAMPPNIIFNLLPLRLGIDKAIPLALIVNELLTNALKHAFADGRPGEIRITLRKRSDRSRPVTTDNMDATPGEGTARRAPTDPRPVPTDLGRAPTYELTITDNGVGLPAGFNPADQKSLGLQLVNMLTKQLNGALAIESSGGTSVAVTFNNNEKNEKQS